VHPGRDEKVLTSWNGLMLAAFAEAARYLDRDDYRSVAERNAEFLLREMRQGSGRLLRTWKARPEGAEGAGEAKLNGYLEDYSYLIEGLLELYQTTFEPRWFVAAHELAETMLEHFADAQGTLYDTSDDHETLITRPRDLQDNATPSGNAMAVTALLRLAGLTNETGYIDAARTAISQVLPLLGQYPSAFGQWLQAFMGATSPLVEVAIAGDPGSSETADLLGVVRAGYRPFVVVAVGDCASARDAVPLLRNRSQLNGRATAYVCQSFSCRRPTADPGELARLLADKGANHADQSS
jgi:uncharacterized protein YyaL (SSP411 family)